MSLKNEVNIMPLNKQKAIRILQACILLTSPVAFEIYWFLLFSSTTTQKIGRSIISICVKFSTSLTFLQLHAHKVGVDVFLPDAMILQESIYFVFADDMFQKVTNVQKQN